MDLVQTITLSAGLAWASGSRLYLVVFLAGILSYSLLSRLLRRA